MNDHHPITNISYVSKINKTKILALIRSRELISRAEIGKEMGLSLPTVSRLVDSLIHHERLVTEEGTAAPSRGRPPQLVRFAGDSNYVIGLNIGATTVSGILSNLNAEIQVELRIPSQPRDGFHTMMRRTAELIERLILESQVDSRQVLGVGIGIGGLVDPQTSRISYSAIFDWIDVDIPAELNRYVNLPIKVDNDVRVMALGELWYGIGEKVKNFICVHVGYGIGAAYIQDGKPYFGSTGMAGEFGYITVEKDSSRADSGIRGCLQSLASGHAIAEKAQEALSENPDSLLHSLCGGDLSNITAKNVADAAIQGDALSKEILAQAAEYLGIGIANLVNLLNPQAIVIGGGVSRTGDDFIDCVRKAVYPRVLPGLTNKLIIQPSAHGNRSKVLGAIALALNEVLSLNIGHASPYESNGIAAKTAGA